MPTTKMLRVTTDCEARTCAGSFVCTSFIIAQARIYTSVHGLLCKHGAQVAVGVSGELVEWCSMCVVWWMGVLWWWKLAVCGVICATHALQTPTWYAVAVVLTSAVPTFTSTRSVHTHVHAHALQSRSHAPYRHPRAHLTIASYSLALFTTTASSLPTHAFTHVHTHQRPTQHNCRRRLWSRLHSAVCTTVCSSSLAHTTQPHRTWMQPRA